jgi:hypothetical protein
MTHQPLTAGLVHEISLESDQAARRDNRLDGYARRMMIYCEDFAFAIGDGLQDVAKIFIW